MNENSIDSVMKTAMNSIKDMIDVNTIVGDKINVSEEVTIIPISKVCFGFATGGTELYKNNIFKKNGKEDEERYPFGGGSGSIVNITPIGFVIIDEKNIGAPKFIPVEHIDTIDKLLDYVPDLLEKTTKTIEKFLDSKNTYFSKSNINIDK